MWRALKKAFAADANACAQLGLMPSLPRFDREGRTVKTPPQGETTFEVYGVRPARRVGPDGSFRTDVVAVIDQRRPEPIDGKDMANGWFWFRGGATLILDPRERHQEIRYSIVKNSSSLTRLERQRSTVSGSFVSPLRALYFGHAVGEPFAALHASYRELDHG